MRTKTKHTFALLALCGALALAVAAACFAAPVSARAVTGESTPVANWTDGLTYDADYAYGGGSGTAPDPYVIATEEDLAQLAANQNDLGHITGEGDMYAQSYSRGKYFRLGADLDMSGKNWIPIGNLVNGTHTVAGEDGDVTVTDEKRNVTFTGGFDFAGHKVTGLEHTGYDGQYYGLFGTFAGGRINNPNISYGDVTVNFTAGDGSVYDDAIYAHVMIGGVVGLSIGDCTIGEAGGDTDVRVTYEGDFLVQNSIADRRTYLGGMVGYAMGGTLGADSGNKTGNTTVVTEIGAQGSFRAETNGELIYIGGIFGVDSSDFVVGARAADNTGDVTVRFVNKNTTADAVGFGASSTSGSSRFGGIAGFSSGLIGTAGNGNVTVDIENHGIMQFENTGDMSYAAGILAEKSGGVLGSKGNGNVTFHVENYGTLRSVGVCGAGGAEVRFAGMFGNMSPSANNEAVVGIDNAASAGNVQIIYENKAGGRYEKQDQWTSMAALILGYVPEARSLVGTKGTGTVQYIAASALDDMILWTGADGTEQRLRYPTVSGNAGGKVGSLNGGDAVDQSKTFGYFITDGDATGYGKCNAWETFLDTTDKLTATDHASWEIAGATADGVCMTLTAESGYGFLGWADGSEVQTDESGKPVAVFTGTNTLPAANLLELDTVQADFTAVTYNGQTQTPVVTGYTVVALDENGEELALVLPDTYRVKAIELYKGNMFVGTKRYAEAQTFVINKAANDTTVPRGAVMLDVGTETYTADGKYEIAQDAAFEHVLPNSGSLTAYKGASIYVRERATATHSASAATEVPLTAYTLTLPEGEGYTIVSSDDRSSFLAGAEFAFAVLPDDGWIDDEISVKANGTALTADNGVYTIVLQENTTVTVEGIVREVYYTVTLTGVEGITLTPVTAGQTQVKAGESFSFTATAAQDFQGEYTVFVNGTKVEAQSGVYTVANVQENITVTVTVKTPDNPDDPNKGDDKPDDGNNDNTNTGDNEKPTDGGKKKKCGGNAAGSFPLLGVLLAAAAGVLALRRKKARG